MGWPSLRCLSFLVEGFLVTAQMVIGDWYVHSAPKGCLVACYSGQPPAFKHWPTTSLYMWEQDTLGIIQISMIFTIEIGKNLISSQWYQFQVLAQGDVVATSQAQSFASLWAPNVPTAVWNWAGNFKCTWCPDYQKLHQCSCLYLTCIDAAVLISLPRQLSCSRHSPVPLFNR